MVERESAGTRLAEHDTALSSLLESLLAEVPEAPPPVQSAQAPHVAAAVRQRTDRVPEQFLLNETATPPIEKPTVEQAAVAAASPAWAQTAFRVLLFRIGGYRFAIPLVLMRGVCLIPAGVRQLPGQPAWHLGLVRYRDRSVLLADLGRLVAVQARCRAPRYLLLIGDGDLALICDQIEDTVLVATDEIRWRRTPDRDGWLVGMLTGPMCALLDADALAQAIGHG